MKELDDLIEKSARQHMALMHAKAALNFAVPNNRAAAVADVQEKQEAYDATQAQIQQIIDDTMPLPA